MQHAAAEQLSKERIQELVIEAEKRAEQLELTTESLVECKKSLANEKKSRKNLELELKLESDQAFIPLNYAHNHSVHLHVADTGVCTVQDNW